jgi:7-cyano-7-deazaguanine synthase
MLTIRWAGAMLKAMILLSGGIDSAVCLAMHRDDRRVAIGFDYGQPHAIELEWAKLIAERESVPFEVVTLPGMGKVGPLVFAGRNAVLISVAASRAAAMGFDAVVIGSNFSDHQDFPDCRREFLQPLGEAIKFAYGISVLAPLLWKTKAQVVEDAKDLGIPLELTWTCYEPRKGQPCRKCHSCKVREAAGA